MSEQLHHLSIDLETYSTVSIGAAGSYRYILDPSFEILLFAYSLDGMPVEVIDVASGQIIPLWLKNALKNPLYIKHAYNAAFEWFALSKYLGWLPPRSVARYDAPRALLRLPGISGRGGQGDEPARR